MKLTLKQQLQEACKIHKVKEYTKLTVDQLFGVLKKATLKEEENQKTLKEEAEKIFEEGKAVITEVVASYSRKVNLGNYESQDFFESMKASVEKGVDVQAVSAKLAFECQQAVLYQVKKLEPKESKPF